MAVEIIEGFDTFSAAQLARRYPTLSGTWTMITGRNSVGQALRNNGSFAGDYCTILVASRSEYYFGLDVRTDTFNNQNAIAMNAGYNGNAFFTWAPSGVLHSTWGDSSAGVLLLNTWQNVQFHIVISATVGVFQVKVDGVMVINLTGINTGSTNVAGISLVGINVGTHDYDNVWVFNTLGFHSNTWPVGAMTVQPLYPTGDGTYTGWTPNSGSTHYNRVNNTTADDDTTYNSATTINAADSYTIGSLSGTISQIHGVRVSAVVEKDDVGSKTMHVIAKSGSTVSESSDIGVPATYSSQSLYLLDDPNTSAQWTEAAVDAMEVGVKVIS